MGVSNNANVSQVASSASVVDLLLRNPSRTSFVVENDSTAVLYVKLGSDASATSYTARLTQNARYVHDSPSPYIGVVTGIWASANGYAYVTETM